MEDAYYSIIGKVSRVLLLKILYEFNDLIDKHALEAVPIDMDICFEEYLGVIFEETKTGCCLYLESKFDETTGEFIDYTGMYIFEFVHPIIYSFFKELEKIKDTQRWDILVSIFDDNLLSILRNAFGRSDIFNDFLKDENNIIRGLEFTFSGLDDPIALMGGLLKLEKTLEGLLTKVKEGGL